MDQPLSREFMAAYFPNDVQLDRAPSRSQPSRENIGHELLPPPGRNLGMFGTPAPTASSSTNSNQLSFDAFGIDLGAMNVQGHSLDGQGQGHPQHAQMPHGNQQALLEQQLKLAKLRQLQLQHEILQQQVSISFLIKSKRYSTNGQWPDIEPITENHAFRSSLSAAKMAKLLPLLSFPWITTGQDRHLTMACRHQVSPSQLRCP